MTRRRGYASDGEGKISHLMDGVALCTVRCTSNDTTNHATWDFQYGWSVPLSPSL